MIFNRRLISVGRSKKYLVLVDTFTEFVDAKLLSIDSVANKQLHARYLVYENCFDTLLPIVEPRIRSSKRKTTRLYTVASNARAICGWHTLHFP